MNRTIDARLRALEALEAAPAAALAYVLLIPGDNDGEWIAPDGSIWYDAPGGRLVELCED